MYESGLWVTGIVVVFGFLFGIAPLRRKRRVKKRIANECICCGALGAIIFPLISAMILTEVNIGINMMAAFFVLLSFFGGLLFFGLGFLMCDL